MLGDFGKVEKGKRKKEKGKAKLASSSVRVLA